MHRDKKLELFRKIFFNKCVEDLWFDILTKHTKPTCKVLEIGSGSGKGKQNIKYPKVKKIIGLDLDERVLQNPYLDEAYHISAYEIEKKMKGMKFDIIYSQMVAEHIDDGRKFITNQISVLKNDGILLHSTVSKYYWTSIINDYVPERFKNWLIKVLGSGRNEEDIFPTCYQLNCKKQISDLCDELSLNFEIIRQDEPPGYLRRSFILMFVYLIIHKPLQYVMPSLRPTFIFKIQKNS